MQSVAVTTAAENAPFFAAVERGMFSKLGLDVKVEVMPSGVEIANALASGTVDAGLFGTYPFLTAVSRGVPVVLIGHTWNNALDESAERGAVGHRARRCGRAGRRSRQAQGQEDRRHARRGRRAVHRRGC